MHLSNLQPPFPDSIAQEVKELPTLLAVRPRAEEPPRYRYPELDVIFAGSPGHAAGLHAGNGSPRTPGRSASKIKLQPQSPAGPQQLRSPAGTAAGRQEAVGPAGPRGGTTTGEAPARRELLGGGASGSRDPPSAPGSTSATAAAPAGGAGARMRTAAEIRAAYGRPAVTMEGVSAARAPAGAPAAQRAAGEVGSVMAENRRKLEERGERLSALQDKGADLADSAAGFVQLARELAGKEQQRARRLGI